MHVSAQRYVTVDNKGLQNVKNFKYLCSGIVYQNDKVIRQKIAKHAEILGMLSGNFETKILTINL